MGWFDEQIEYRKRKEIDLLNDSFQEISRAVVGHKIGDGWIQEGADVRDAVVQLLKYFNLKPVKTPDKFTELEDILDYQLSSTGILYREITLRKGWHRDAMGALIAQLKNGTVITIVQGTSGSYEYIDPVTAKKVRVTSAVEAEIGNEAYCFYRPLPSRSLKLHDLFVFMRECLTVWDFVSYALSALAITLIGMLLPKLNQLLMGDVVTYQSRQLLMAVAVFMLCITVGTFVFNIIRQFLINRISVKMSINVSAASMMRVLSLPADFFKNYSAGELNQYLSYMNSLCSTIVNSIITTGITGVFSLVYLTQIFGFARSLVVPSLLMTILSLAVSVVAASVQIVWSRERMKLQAKEKGLVYSLISGIQKIRLSGAENRAFAKWAKLYADEASRIYNPPAIIKLNSVFTTAITLIGTIVMYYIAVKSQVSVADYYAFNTAYSYIATAFSSLASMAVSAGTIKPILDLVAPLLDAEPEIEDDKETVTQISGSIEFSHVSFRYGEKLPLILDDLSLSIGAHQYVAIVGKTGCGKSTLMRLLLGFEQPTSGSIFFDKKDIKRLNMRSVRKKIGTVMQDGKLFGGSIFENITISQPTLTLKDAWEAAEISGLAEDIRRMPMGMNTMIQEGAGGFSGGQKQRLMIARAIAPKPKLLLLDEATSALDNITQKQVSEALDQMKCTRIVIAHRLSTIQHCDRILVLDGGRIIEDGTYEELIAANGFFADLIARQRVNK